MAQTTEWLPAIWNCMKKVKSSISTVFGQFSYLSSFSQYMHPPSEETKSHNRFPTSAFD